MHYSKDMNVAEIVDSHPDAKDVLLQFGLPCYKCIVAYHETLEEGVSPHELDVDEIVRRLNELKPQGKKK